MSKTYGNYVGIDEPADAIFGKLMSISDDLMLKYYELLSDISIEDLNTLKAGITAGTVHPRDAEGGLCQGDHRPVPQRRCGCRGPRELRKRSSETGRFPTR